MPKSTYSITKLKVILNSYVFCIPIHFHCILRCICICSEQCIVHVHRRNNCQSKLLKKLEKNSFVPSNVGSQSALIRTEPQGSARENLEAPQAIRLLIWFGLKNLLWGCVNNGQHFQGLHNTKTVRTPAIEDWHFFFSVSRSTISTRVAKGTIFHVYRKKQSFTLAAKEKQTI